MGLQARNPFENGELDDIEIEAPEGMEPLRAPVVPTEAEAAAVEDLDPIELTDIHHVGIAVEDLDAAIVRYRYTFGATVMDREVLDAEHVEVAILEVGDSRLRLASPTDDGSWLVEFLDGQGSGLSHVGFEVVDIEAAMEDLGRRGWELIDETPQDGLAGTRTAYVHPPEEPGTLIQLVQPT